MTKKASGSYSREDLRASIKLLIKKVNAINDEIIIIITLAIPRLSDLLIAPVKGLTRPMRITNVRPTAIWARTRFPFLNPGVMVIRIIPTIAGIKELTEGVSDVRYAQLPKIINTIALNKFIKYGFILAALSLNIQYVTMFNLISNIFVSTTQGSPASRELSGCQLCRAPFEKNLKILHIDYI